jgi:hypothetical protein
MGNEVDVDDDGAMGNEVDIDGDSATGDNDDDDKTMAISSSTPIRINCLLTLCTGDTPLINEFKSIVF